MEEQLSINKSEKDILLEKIQQLEEQNRLLLEKLNQNENEHPIEEQNRPCIQEEVTKEPNSSSFEEVNAPNFLTYKKTQGSKDKGREYEYLLCAYYGLKLFMDETVIDFEMTTNNKNYGTFDDISLKVKFENREDIYLMQLKHKEAEKSLTETHFARSENFGLFKYFQTCGTFNSDETCIILTNCSCKIDNGATFSVFEKAKKGNNNNSGEQNQKNVEVRVVKEKISASSNLNSVVVPGKNSKNQSFRFVVNNERYTKNIYLLCDQGNVNEVKALIGGIVQLFEPKVEELFVAFVAKWWEGNFVFTKYDFMAKMTELSFSPWVQTVTGVSNDNSFAKLLKRALMQFAITIVPNISEEDIRNVILLFNHENETSKRDEAKTAAKYGLQIENDRNIVLWYLNKTPLFVKVDGRNLEKVKAIMKFLAFRANRKRLVLYGHITRENILELQNLSFCKFFTSLHDLENVEYFNDIISNLEVFIDKKEKTSLTDLKKEDPHIIKPVTTNHLCQAVNDGYISVATRKNNIEVSDFRIPRKLLMEGAEIEETQIVESLDRFCSCYVLCGPAGIGKSFLFRALCETICSNFWSIYVNLIEENSFLEEKPDVDEVISHFLNIEDNEESVDAKITEIICKPWKTKKVHIFLDGLDEIGPQCQRVVFAFTKEVIAKGFKVWINSREELRDEISEYLWEEDATMIELRDLSTEEQQMYLQNGLRDLYSDEEIVEITEIVFESLDVTKSKGLLGNPSQLNAVVDSFNDNGRHFFKELVEDRFMVLTKVMEHMVNQAHFRFIGKCRSKYDHILKTFTKTYEKQYRVLALQLCLDKEAFAKLNLDSKDLLRHDVLGLIRYIDAQNQAVFIHQKYAEYFACLWLSNKLERLQSLKEEFFSMDYQNLKQMFDIILADKCKLHLAVIYAKSEQFCKHVDKVGEKDRGNRTPIHMLCSYGIPNVETHFEEKIAPLITDETCFYDIDKIFQFDCIAYLRRCGCPDFRSFISQQYNLVFRN